MSFLFNSEEVPFFRLSKGNVVDITSTLDVREDVESKSAEELDEGDEDDGG